jgi:hypothetical protein
MSPQTLILPKSSPNKYHFFAERGHFKKKILPIRDPMTSAQKAHLPVIRFSSDAMHILTTSPFKDEIFLGNMHGLLWF